MNKLDLANDEVILLDDHDVDYSGTLDVSCFDDLYLTNKRIIGLGENRRGAVRLVIPFGLIKKYQGEYCIDSAENSDLGECLRIQTLNGIEEFCIPDNDQPSVGLLKSMFSDEKIENKRLALWICKIKEVLSVDESSDNELESSIEQETPVVEQKAPTIPEIKPQVVEVIRCRKCGAKMSPQDRFCPECGTPVVEEEKKIEPAPAKEAPHKNPNKCPVCGEILPSDAIRCPSCGYEIHGREAVSSVKEFAKEFSSINDEEKKMVMIKMFPVPNTKEDITEFMYLATTNFDAGYYATHRHSENVDSAWFAKIEQCREKAHAMFAPDELAPIEKLYQDSVGKVAKIRKTKLIMTISGIAVIILSVVLLCITPAMKSSDSESSNSPLVYVALGLLAVGIIVLVIGLKKKKSHKEVEEAKIAKANKKNNH